MGGSTTCINPISLLVPHPIILHFLTPVGIIECTARNWWSLHVGLFILSRWIVEGQSPRQSIGFSWGFSGNKWPCLRLQLGFGDRLRLFGRGGFRDRRRGDSFFGSLRDRHSRTGRLFFGRYRDRFRSRECVGRGCR